VRYEDAGPGPLAQVLQEPVASEHRHAGEGVWFLEQVGGPGHDLESGLAREGGQGPLVEP
jgi:hypothetical protein